VNVARDLRTPFFIVALMAIASAVALEIGSTWFLSAQQARSSQSVQSQLGIPSLWLLDVSLLWTLALGALALVMNKNLLARAQGIATLILSIVIIVVGLKTLLTAFVLLIVMIALLSSFFGWLVYLPLFGLFGTGSAATVLGAITFFKLAAVMLLVLAQQRFLESKGLVLLLVLSLVCDLLLSFLQSLPPGILVSVTDAVGAIVICVIAIIYAIFQAVWAIVAILRAVV
jgi:hypothetical protein